MLSVTLTICIEASVMVDVVMVLHDILCEREQEVQGWRGERQRVGRNEERGRGRED